MVQTKRTETTGATDAMEVDVAFPWDLQADDKVHIFGVDAACSLKWREVWLDFE